MYSYAFRMQLNWTPAFDLALPTSMEGECRNEPKCLRSICSYAEQAAGVTIQINSSAILPNYYCFAELILNSTLFHL